MNSPSLRCEKNRHKQKSFTHFFLKNCAHQRQTGITNSTRNVHSDAAARVLSRKRPAEGLPRSKRHSTGGATFARGDLFGRFTDSSP
ncbi:hypothetical protein AVEN_179590-1 [Araneus ventricosus]|uniref:Uncharacterized protein n=1 Tax=Araneus ventricosus TaxID=182803 RepID=A0A4Y2BC82_ARAVE|nr:hypothetical protein AVEN_179590-1 [Araneus ventricosus]